MSTDDVLPTSSIGAWQRRWWWYRLDGLDRVRRVEPIQIIADAIYGRHHRLGERIHRDVVGTGLG